MRSYKKEQGLDLKPADRKDMSDNSTENKKNTVNTGITADSTDPASIADTAGKEAAGDDLESYYKDLYEREK